MMYFLLTKTAMLFEHIQVCGIALGRPLTFADIEGLRRIYDDKIWISRAKFSLDSPIYSVRSV